MRVKNKMALSDFGVNMLLEYIESAQIINLDQVRELLQTNDVNLVCNLGDSPLLVAAGLA
jgi:hypothetical protein